MHKKRLAFTLIELLVVVLIIGILASVAIPQYFRVVEKGRIAEATNYSGAIRSAEERYALKTAAYTGDPNQLDISIPSFKYFSNAPSFQNGVVSAGWQVTFTRNTSPAQPAPYTSAYTIIFNSLTSNYSSSDANVIRDLLPQ
jgi:prepilin-type N-terminal cleavage/methylation domain-containing protein